ncbi:unnamed protein product [Protopolystoma xenopodis]|uniref:Uncharacterized protein n=1 Tax=Protopolystoma xenopodis TaxID=117903 RepID=A0A3S5BL76_9PLAT|nr:unnamed protein product [Protopolystoma xenopodis]
MPPARRGNKTWQQCQTERQRRSRLLQVPLPTPGLTVSQQPNAPIFSDADVAGPRTWSSRCVAATTRRGK